ncbi:unnamed protein product [Rhodiola kirilowii]
MSLVAWNCRGLGNPLAIRALKDVLNTSKSQIIGLVETKATKQRCEVIRARLGFRCCFSVPARGRSGGLALFWNNPDEVSITNFSFYHIDFMVHMTVPFRATLFYGAPRASLRFRSWELLRQLKDLSSAPWCVLGDFNEILSFSETSQNAQRRSGAIAQFRSAVGDCHLGDLGFKGYRFTYSNKRRDAYETRCRLDRVLANPAWRHLYPDALVYHLSTFHSDHSPIQLCLRPVRHRRQRMFRYEAMWDRDPRFRELLQSLWANQAHHLDFLDKLDRIKRPVMDWNQRVFGNVDKKLHGLRDALNTIRQCPRTDANVAKEIQLTADMDEWLRREEIMWKQRSRVSWLKAGDNNTAFFHRKANGRRKANFISQLRDAEGRTQTDQAAMQSIAIDYFTGLFSNQTGHTPVSLEDVLASMADLPGRVTRSHNDLLLSPYTERDIYAAVHQLAPCKAPGLDGLPAEFLQRHWHTIKTDFVNLCLSFLNDGILPAGLNDTIIVLIPKQQRMSDRLENFRPISLASVTSKVVAKAITARLQLVLPEIISFEQSAFVKDRLISDNFILAHECAHYIRKSGRGRKCYGSLKLDMTKAYDRIDWTFLRCILLQLGFHQVWVRRIMDYVTAVRYCIRFNGDISEVFTPQRGLRQGDPLSPYLFIICTEWLSHKLRVSHANGLLRGLTIARSAPVITHLFFADDSLLLFEATVATPSILKGILTEYERLAGQRVNYNKSELVLSPNTSAAVTQSFLSTLSVTIVDRHKRYLGLPLHLGRQVSANFLQLLDRVHAKSKPWYTSTLSCGGREVLIKSVLLAIPQFHMQCFQIPQGVLRQYQSLVKRFWWSGKQQTSPMHWLKYSVLCQPKETGGLGFRDLHLLNQAFLAKQGWRIFSQPTLLLSQVMKARYFRNSDIFSASLGHRPSRCWRSIYGALHLLRSGSSIDINGVRTWPHSADGNYSVRSGYNFLSEVHRRSTSSGGETSRPRVITSFWKSFWRLPVPRKIKIFGWRSFHNTLPVGTTLCARNIAVDCSCPLCNYKHETQLHVLVQCWWANAVWQEMGVLDWLQFGSFSTMADVLFYLCSYMDPKSAACALVTLWYIWSARNKWKHDRVSMSPQDAVARIKVLANEYYRYHVDNTIHHFQCSDFLWKPPSIGTVKVNCDASWSESSKSGSVAVVARDAAGTVLSIRARHQVHCDSATDCEGWSIEEGLRLCSELRVSKALIESDSTEAVIAINCRNHFRFGTKHWFSRCLTALDDNPFSEVMLIRREANASADLVARFARIKGWSWLRMDACPLVPHFQTTL